MAAGHANRIAQRRPPVTAPEQDCRIPCCNQSALLSCHCCSSLVGPAASDGPSCARRRQQESSSTHRHAPATTTTQLVALPGTSRRLIDRSAAGSNSNNDNIRRKCPHRPISQWPLFVSVAIVLLGLLAASVGCVVVHQVRFIASKTGRTDYALAGETIELSCHYLMKDEAEDIKQLVWSKDGKNFLRWRKNKPGLEVLSYTFKGHIEPSSKHSHLTISNVTTDMHGKYKCAVRTDLGSHETEHDLVVISQSNCRADDWHVTSEPDECRETLRFDCRNMFPRPVLSCGLWNGRLDKFIRSVVVDISEEPNKDTYRVRYSDVFDLRQQAANKTSIAQSDLLQYAGHLLFKCDIIVPETSWKLSLTHKLFNYTDACYQTPLEAIERMRDNYNQHGLSRLQRLDDYDILSSSLDYELIPSKAALMSADRKGSSASKLQIERNCWQKPKIGTLARLSCARKITNQYYQHHQYQPHNPQLPQRPPELHGARLMECRRNGWVPIVDAELDSKRLKGVPRRRLNGRRADQQPGDMDLQSMATDATGTDDSDDSAVDNILPAIKSNHLDADTDPVATTTPAAVEDANIPASTKQYPATQFDNYRQSPAIGYGETSDQPLTPSQVASLLPTCISVKPRISQHATRLSRLPLTDGETTSRQNSRGNNRQSKAPRYKPMFSFTSSSASARAGLRIGPTTNSLLFCMSLETLRSLPALAWLLPLMIILYTAYTHHRDLVIT